MKKIPTKKVCLLGAKYVLILATIFSCNDHRQVQKKNQEDKIPPKINNSLNKSFASPKQTLLTEINQPVVIKVGKPIVNLDSLIAGAPFFTNYNTEQGLAQTNVSSIFEDNSGNIWFGTGGGGVSRYDGKNFTNYTTTQGLAGNSVMAIIQDKSGNLWFATQGAGVSRYDGKKFVNFTKTQGLPSNSVLSMMLDDAGNIWFSTAGGGASRYDGEKFTNYTTKDGLAGNFIQGIVQDKEGNYWFAALGYGISKYDGKKFTNYKKEQGLASDVVWSIIKDHTGNIWISTGEKGVSRYDGKSFTNFTTAEGLASNMVNHMLEDRNGNIWFVTKGGGVSRYDGKKFINYTIEHGLTDNFLNSIMEDKAGNIWLGTNGAGVNRYDGASFTKFTTGQGMMSNTVWGFVQDKTGDIWFATQEGGANKYDGKSFTNFTKSQGLPNNTIWSIMQDKAGNIWMGTGGSGAILYDGKTFTNYTTAQGLMGAGVMSMIQDKSGDIWFGSVDGGVSRFDGKSFTNYKTEQGLADNNVYSIMQDRSGDIWFGTQGGGVSRFDGKTFTNYTKAQGLGGNSVLSILQDKAGAIWLGTDGGGASRFDGKSFKNFTTSLGLADDEVYAMTEDAKRNIIWFGTNLGLSGLKPIPSSNDDTLGKFEIFNKNTGYPLKDLNTNALYLDNNGIIWVGGGDNKVIRFDYDAMRKDLAPLNLKVVNIKVNNEDIVWNNLIPKSKDGKTADSLALLNEMVTTFGKPISESVLDNMKIKFGKITFDSIALFYPVPINLMLPYEDKNLTIDFVAIDPSKPKQVKYQYKLEGYNSDWSPLGTSTTATFGNIPEGIYTLKLKALSSSGVWSEAEYKFGVRPPWYRTWWAYTLYSLLFIGMIWSVVYFRSQQLRREKRILEEKVDLRTHELEKEKEKVESTLAELKSTQAQLIQSEKMASLGELTSGIAHEIQNPLNFVNNFSEVNIELAAELNMELDKTDIPLEEKKNLVEILDDITKNQQKINHHGKRADSIVKGMLQHSRSSTGVKERTDINALADEYLRLGYHGVRAKDKEFNATIKTDFDNSIEKINVIPQDMGRVLLNVYNNAFYTVAEKKKLLGEGYDPTISVITKKSGNQVTITVSDNGGGIPQKALDKIFQPFFTTKPTGQGTGLGLSLSYDIIKAHGGEIKVDTREGEGSEFVIYLPI